MRVHVSTHAWSPVFFLLIKTKEQQKTLDKLDFIFFFLVAWSIEVDNVGPVVLH